MMKFSGTGMFLFICFFASTCLVNGEFLEDSLDSVKEILVSLSKGIKTFLKAKTFYI